MKLKHTAGTAFGIAGATAFFVAAAVWATPQPVAKAAGHCPGKTVTASTAVDAGGGASGGRAAP